MSNRDAGEFRKTGICKIETVGDSDSPLAWSFQPVTSHDKRAHRTPESSFIWTPILFLRGASWLHHFPKVASLKISTLQIKFRGVDLENIQIFRHCQPSGIHTGSVELIQHSAEGGPSTKKSVDF